MIVGLVVYYYGEMYEGRRVFTICFKRQGGDGFYAYDQCITEGKPSDYIERVNHLAFKYALSRIPDFIHLAGTSDWERSLYFEGADYETYRWITYNQKKYDRELAKKYGYRFQHTYSPAMHNPAAWYAENIRKHPHAMTFHANKLMEFRKYINRELPETEFVTYRSGPDIITALFADVEEAIKCQLIIS